MLGDIGEVTSEMHESLVLHERPGGSPEVEHRSSRPEADPPPGDSRSEAPVDVLVVYEESFVEFADFFQAFAAHKKEAPANPIHVLFRANRHNCCGPSSLRPSEQCCEFGQW